jgi:hypothetical protein
VPDLNIVLHPELWAFMLKVLVLISIVLSSILLYVACTYGRQTRSEESGSLRHVQLVQEHTRAVRYFLLSLGPLVGLVLALELVLRPATHFVAPLTPLLVVHGVFITAFFIAVWYMWRSFTGTSHPERHRILAQWVLLPSYSGMVATGLCLLYLL